MDEKLRAMAYCISRKYGLEYEDVLQEGYVGAYTPLRLPLPHIRLQWARYAMKRYLTREMRQREAVTAAKQVYAQVRGTSCTFDNLDEQLAKLEPLERQAMVLWLQGESPKRIRLKLKKKNSAVIRGIINTAAMKLAKELGQQGNVECLWPSVARALPKHVYAREGKFMARLRHNGSHLCLGTYATPEEAVKAVQQFKATGKVNNNRRKR